MALTDIPIDLLRSTLEFHEGPEEKYQELCPICKTYRCHPFWGNESLQQDCPAQEECRRYKRLIDMINLETARNFMRLKLKAAIEVVERRDSK